jgi:acetoin utilization deacetylase AcuC-like enzyme
MADDAIGAPEEDLLEELLFEGSEEHDPTGQQWAFVDTSVSDETLETIRLLSGSQMAAMARMSEGPADDESAESDEPEKGWPLL